MAQKTPRLSVTVDERADRERRLAAMGRAIAAYEADHGEISPAELVEQRRTDRRTPRSEGESEGPRPTVED